MRLAAVVGVYLALATWYSLANPLYEAPDEFWHYAFVRHLALGGGLPEQRPGQVVARGEGTQPPLYYATAALAVKLSGVELDPAVGERFFQPNPRSRVGDLSPGPDKNAVFHTPAELPGACAGDCLAARIARLVSVAFGAAAVVGVFLLARAALPERPNLALLAAAAAAVTPQFLYVSSAVSNDGPTAAMTALALACLLDLHRRRLPSSWRFALLGALLGLAALAKASAVLLLVVAAGLLAARVFRARGGPGVRVWAQGAVLTTVVWLVVAGWWYARNVLLYGEPTNVRVMLSIQGLRQPPISPLDVLLSESGQVWVSWWGQFGWTTLLAPGWVYAVAAALTLASIAGGLALLASPTRRALALGRSNGVGLLALWSLVVFAAMLRWSAYTYASYGRLLYPAFAPIVLLLVIGWAGLPGRWTGWALVGLLGLVAVVVPFSFGPLWGIVQD